MPVTEIVVILVSTLIPFAIFFAIYRIVPRREIIPRLIVLSIAWGILARILFFAFFGQLIAAAVGGEILKAAFLFFLFSRRRITNFLNGAMYGAAVGLGLSIHVAIVALISPGGLVESTALEATVILLSNNTIRAITGAMTGFGLGMAFFQRSVVRRCVWAFGGLLVAIFWGTAYIRLNTLVGAGDLFVYTFIFSVSGVGLMLAAERTAQLVRAFQQITVEKKRTDSLLHGVIPVGVQLSAERDFDRLLETVLTQARDFCNAEGATLYLRTSEEQLDYVVVHNIALDIQWGGVSGEAVPFDPIPLFDEKGQPNEANNAAYIAHHGQPVSVPDVYTDTQFELQGTMEFDQRMDYRTGSLLSLPLKSQTDKVIGVLQMVNAHDDLTGEIIPFSREVQEIVESLSALAAAALTSYIRTESLRAKARDLSVAVEAQDVDRQVSEITDSDFFRELEGKVGELRRRKESRLPTKQ